MTPEQQRIAIADACEWGKDSYWVTCVDVLKDLNAMHEALKLFKDDEIQWSKYRYYILGIIEPHRNELHATASQQAESFLRTIGKLTE